MQIKERTLAFRVHVSTGELIDELVNECDCAPSHLLRMALIQGLQSVVEIRDTKREGLTLVQAMDVASACGISAIK